MSAAEADCCGKSSRIPAVKAELKYSTEGGQDSVLRRVLRVGLTVGQCPLIVLYLSYTRPELVL